MWLSSFSLVLILEFNLIIITLVCGCVCVCVCVCVFHSVYSTVQDEMLQERKRQEGLSYTSPHIKLGERGVLLLTFKSVAKMLCQHNTKKVFKIQSMPKMVWMTLDCDMAEVAQSLGRAELDELGLVTGGKGVQKYVIVWLHNFRS